MIKFYLVIFLVFFFSICYGQNSVTLKGKIINSSTKSPIESATVYLSKSKDSTLIEYTITDKNGYFELKLKKTSEPIVLKIAASGFDDFKKAIETFAKDIDFNTLEINESAQLLGEVTIKSEAPPIRIKKDTLEFNANSFKVRPDSNVETLLKQLPGVEVDINGKITVNGREVNQILVNGKPFFDKDGKVALQSLPSDIIKKVQITDTKSKKEELAGQAATSNNASINLTIDKDKNKGFFGKFMGGYGSDKRYESSALINYFKDKRKISVLASSNNINSTGFSMDEIFDNMGGGRNSFYSNENGAFGIGNLSFGGGQGITQSNLVGINYADQFKEVLETNASYFYSEANSRNINKTKTESLLPSGKFFTESDAVTTDNRLTNNFNFEFEYKIDSTTTINYTPKITIAKRTNKAKSGEISRDENNQLLNESTSDILSENRNTNFGNQLTFNKSFRRKGRNISFSAETTNDKTNVDNLNKSSTVFYQSTDPDDVRNQLINTKNTNDTYNFEVEFSEPIRDSLNVNIGAKYLSTKKVNDRNTLDFSSVTQDYSTKNDVLSNFLSSNISTITPQAGINIQKKAFRLGLDLGTAITQFDNYSLYLSNAVNVNKKYAFPFANANMNYNFSKSKSLYFNYDFRVNFPDANQILPFENLANPLNTVTGNANLSPNKVNGFYLSFRNFNAATKTGYNFYARGDLNESQIVSATTFNANRKRTTTYQNVNGTYSTFFGASWNKTIKKEAHTFKARFGLGFNLGLSKGFADLKQFEANALSATPRINLTYEYGELLTINPTYNVTFNDTKYTNYVINSAKNTTHRFNIQTTNYWPKNWVFGNDFGYTYNSNIADGFKKDFYLWNTSLSYIFLNKKLISKVKVYDLLDQNQNATRNITATAIRDEENTVLNRYVMFSLTYKIEKFGGKEKPVNKNRFMY